MPDATQRAYIGAIRCECGGNMEVLEEESVATTGGICYTVECLECRGTGGYNASTMEVYGACERLELVGQ